MVRVRVNVRVRYMVRLGIGFHNPNPNTNPKLNPKHSPYLLSYWGQILPLESRRINAALLPPGARALANPTVAPIDLSQLALSLRRSPEDGPLLQR